MTLRVVTIFLAAALGWLLFHGIGAAAARPTSRAARFVRAFGTAPWTRTATLSADGQALAILDVREENGKYRSFVSQWSTGAGTRMWRAELAGASALLVADYSAVSRVDRRTGWTTWSMSTAGSRCGPLVFPDGKRIITAIGHSVWPGVMSVRDARTGVALRDISTGTEPEKTICALSPDGRLLAAYGTSGKVNPWGTVVIETATWRDVAGSGTDGRLVEDITFTPDSRYLVLAGALPRSTPVEVRDARSLALIRRIGTGEAEGIAFSADGRFLIVLAAHVAPGVIVELWDVRGLMKPTR